MNDPTPAKPPLPWWPYAVFLAIPAVLMIARTPGLPTAETMAEQVSLASLPADLTRRLRHILFVPIGALAVVFVRLTLGLRMLGPFRSILLAVAFQRTGVTVGMTFLLITTVTVLGLRAAIRGLHLPYFGRIMVLLSGVAVMMMMGVMVGSWLEFEPAQTVVFMPIVVLCLVADAFARTMDREGLRSALWRGTVTVLVAMVLTAVVRLPDLSHLMVNFPELVLAQIGLMIIVSRPLAWRLLDDWNPRVVATDDTPDEEGLELFPPLHDSPLSMGQPRDHLRKQVAPVSSLDAKW